MSDRSTLMKSVLIIIAILFLTFAIPLAPSTIILAIPNDLLANGGFEDGTVTWLEYGGIFDVTTDPALVHEGSYAACFSISNTTTARYVYQKVSVQENGPYNFSGWAIKDDLNISGIYLRISWYASEDASGSALSNQDSTTSLTDDQPQYRFLTTGEVIAPSNAHSAKVKAMLDPASTAGVTAYFDDMSFTMTAPLPATQTPSPTLTQSPTDSPTSPPTLTPDASLTATPSPTPSATPTESSTPSATLTLTPTTTPTKSITPTPTASPTTTPTPSSTATTSNTTASKGDILINEVQYNPPQPGSDANFEWLELFNPTCNTVSLVGWKIRDNHASDVIPPLNLSSDSFALVAASQDFYTNFPGCDCTVLFIEDGRIGNGLGNDGDHLILEDSAGTVIDAIYYGNDNSSASSPFPKVAENHSMERSPAGSDFVDNPNPNPCYGLSPSTPTVTPTSSPTTTPTTSPTATATIDSTTTYLTATPTSPVSNKATAHHPESSASPISLPTAIITSEAVALFGVAILIRNKIGKKPR